ncbi:MAG TPA: LysM peptidoglycan-binding domain-containing protein [Actinomycetaceae bacterium]|nr:LysM peptidoglycan-binding domain-containing protein [Actinomycetaceae bacterium]
MSAPALAPSVSTGPRRGHLVLVVSNPEGEGSGAGAAVRPGRPSSSVSNSPATRLTARGRLVRGVIVLASALAVAVGAGSWFGSQHRQSPVATDTVAVAPGDTLWGIASGVATPGRDVREVVYDIQQLNGLGSSEIAAGQTLLVPGPVSPGN